MRNRTKIILFILLLPAFSFAQSHFLPGYVVKLNGDTVRGFIDFRDWDGNPTEISFKHSLTDEAKTSYSLHTINSFSVDGIATYQKFVCKISMDETNISRLSDGRDTSFKINTVFLKVLEKGPNLALYSYTDNIKTRFYIGETPDYKPTPLVYRVYYDLSSPSGNSTIYENTYQKQLFALASKYKKFNTGLVSIIEKSSYIKDDLLEIVSQINGVSKAQYKKEYAEHTKFVFFAGVAANISSTTTVTGSPYQSAGGTSSSSVLPGGNIGLSVILNPLSDKVEIRAEVAVAPAKFNSSYKLGVSPYGSAQASYNQLGISFIPEIIYNAYNTQNFKFYLGVGFAITHYSFSNAFFGDPTSSNSQSFPQESYQFATNDNTFVLKGGFRIHKNVEIFVNYFTSVQPSHSGYFKFNYTNTQMGISYLFGM